MYKKEIGASIPKGAARSFWSDLMGTLRFTTKGTHGILTTEAIAERLGITPSVARAYLYKCAELGLTDRQGGAWVV